MNHVLFIASLLVPHNKFVYVDLALEEMFGEDVGKKIKFEVDKYWSSLFGDYVKKLTEGSKIPSSSSTSSNDSSSDSRMSGGSVVRNKLKKKREKEDSGSSGAKSELEKYLNEDQEPYGEKFDVLGWWKINAPRFPILSELARDLLDISISSVALESAFSTGGRILDSFRSSLTPKLVQSLICVQDWLRSEPLPVNVDEYLDILSNLKLVQVQPSFVLLKLDHFLEIF